VRRVEETGRGSSLLGSLGLETGDIVTFSSDTGNDGDGVVDTLLEGSNHFDLLVFGKESTFAGVTEDDETLDSLNGCEPRTDSLNSVVVDGSVFVEGGDGSRSDTGHIKTDSTSRVGEVRGRAAVRVAVGVTVRVTVGDHC
jgi:hypothetical protein